MTDAKLRLPTCGNKLPVQTSLGGLQLPPKVCLLKRGHSGPHTDGSATWMNMADLRERLNLKAR